MSMIYHFYTVAFALFLFFYSHIMIYPGGFVKKDKKVALVHIFPRIDHEEVTTQTGVPQNIFSDIYHSKNYFPGNLIKLQYSSP